MATDIIERWKASAQHQLCLALFTIYPCQIRVHESWQS